MATYSRLGTFIVGGDLTADPLGKIHRGLTITGSRFDRHKLLRTFSEELVEAGIGGRMEEAGRTAAQLAGARGFASAYQLVGGKLPHVACDYSAGRSLAQLIEKARQEQIPLGVDHALSVLQGLSQSITVLHGKGFAHGTLSPHSVWVSFEGATQILDAPFGPALHALLPKCPNMARQLEAYRPSQGANAHQQDFYALGSMLYELLTLESLPAPAQIPAAIQEATLKAAQEEAPVPAELQALLRRLLLVDAPFESASTFVVELERVLYDGDYSPTTFNMAFFMHTLFREENEYDTQAIKADMAADFTPLMDAVTNTRGAEGVDSQKVTRWAMIGGSVVVALLGLLFYNNWSKNRDQAAMMAKFEKLQEEMNSLRAKAEAAEKKEQVALTGLAKLEQDLKDKKITKAEFEKLSAPFVKQAQEARQEKAAATQQVQVAEQNIQTLRPPTPVTPKQVPGAAPTTAAPQLAAATPAAPQPQAAAPTPAAPQAVAAPAAPAPQPAATAPAPSQAQPTTAAPITETPVEIVNRASITTHLQPRAKQMMQNFRGRQFSVRVRVFVGADGQPKRTIIDQASGYDWGMEDAAEKAAMATTYKPATQNGKPVSGWITVPFAATASR